MRKLFLLMLIFASIKLNGQNTHQNDNFTYVVTKAEGDLNNDSISDYAIVTQDTINEQSPYKLEIYFGQPNGEFNLILSTEKAIEPRFPDGKEGIRSGNGFSGIIIDKGVLSVNNLLLRGHYEHKFKFQNGHFELIGFSGVYSAGDGNMTTINFDLLTGIRTEKSERYDIDKINYIVKRNILISPLPHLGGFNLFDNDSELY